MPRPLASLAALAVLAVALSGCAPDIARVRAPAAAPAAPFANEEEALAAAVEVYARFTELGDQIGRDGGRDAERLSEAATGQFLEDSVEGFTSWIDKGWRQVGVRSFHDATLQQHQSGNEGAVIIYVCEDISKVDVLDALDQSVVAQDRPDSNYLQVGFDRDAGGELLVSSRERWDDRSC